MRPKVADRASAARRWEAMCADALDTDPDELRRAWAKQDATGDPTLPRRRPTPGQYAAAGSVRVSKAGPAVGLSGPPGDPTPAETAPSGAPVDSEAAPRVLGLVVPPHLAHVVDAALERHLGLIYSRGGSFDPEVHALGLAVRRLARLHALGLTSDVPMPEQTFDIGAVDGGRWIPVADYAAEAGIGPRGALQRIARGKVEARQVAGRWFVKTET